jgi:SAM-dependent MidA family methyltransferase
MFMSGKLPGPDPLSDDLRRRIHERGTVGFDEFMAAALYDPDRGYYTSQYSRTGKGGDFFTSVSVGPVFGRLLAAQCAEMWELLGRPVDFTLVEQGANDGQLMADVLTALEKDHHSCTPRAIIIEPLPQRQAVQQTRLTRWADRVAYVANEADLPAFTGVFFANELLDAFPVKLLVRENGAWLERRVGTKGGQIIFVETPIDDPSILAEANRWPLPADAPRFCTEFAQDLSVWMTTIASKLVRGWMLLIDYGHPAAARYHPARAGGTLAAYRNHQRQDDLLADPGAQDLTAHVDFTRVAQLAEENRLKLVGFTDQHHALAALAARVFPPMRDSAPDAAAAREMRALRQLLHPECMGTSFKFLAMSKGIDATLSAFAFGRDARRELYG